MTIEETINELVDYVAENDKLTISFEAVTMAREALEKQIPKRLKNDGANWYRCPNGCEIHKKPFEKDWHCPKCGQAIDWTVKAVMI